MFFFLVYWEHLLHAINFCSLPKDYKQLTVLAKKRVEELKFKKCNCLITIHHLRKIATFLFGPPVREGSCKIASVCVYVFMSVRNSGYEETTSTNFLIFDMKLGEHIWRKLAKPDFPLKFIVTQIWAQNGIKLETSPFISRPNPTISTTLRNNRGHL